MRFRSGPGAITRGAIGALALIPLATGCASPVHVRAVRAAPVNGATGWSKSTLVVHKDDKVRFRVGNVTAKQHGFSVDGYGIVETVDPGKTITVDFHASQKGRFRIYCQLHSTHLPATLVVQ